MRLGRDTQAKPCLKLSLGGEGSQLLKRCRHRQLLAQRVTFCLGLVTITFEILGFLEYVSKKNLSNITSIVVSVLGSNIITRNTKLLCIHCFSWM